MEYNLYKALPTGGFELLESFSGTPEEAQAEIDAKAQELGVQVVAEYVDGAITTVVTPS